MIGDSSPRYERNEFFEALATLKEHYQMLPPDDFTTVPTDWKPDTIGLTGHGAPPEETIEGHADITSEGWIHGDPEAYDDGA